MKRQKYSALSFSAVIEGSLLIVLFLLSWYFSSQVGDVSQSQSDAFLILFSFLPRSLASFLIRKGAHFTLYFLTGAVSALFIHTLAEDLHRNWTGGDYFIRASLYPLFMAAADETHQHFVAGRSGQISDVLLDFAASCIAICLIWVFLRHFPPKKRG